MGKGNKKSAASPKDKAPLREKVFGTESRQNVKTRQKTQRKKDRLDYKTGVSKERGKTQRSAVYAAGGTSSVSNMTSAAKEESRAKSEVAKYNALINGGLEEGSKAKNDTDTPGGQGMPWEK